MSLLPDAVSPLDSILALHIETLTCCLFKWSDDANAATAIPHHALAQVATNAMVRQVPVGDVAGTVKLQETGKAARLVGVHATGLETEPALQIRAFSTLPA